MSFRWIAHLRNRVQIDGTHRQLQIGDSCRTPDSVIQNLGFLGVFDRTAQAASECASGSVGLSSFLPASVYELKFT